MSDLADYVLALVRAQLKQHPAFAGVRRDDLDVYLGDLERDIRCELEGWAGGIQRVAYEDGRADAEELEAERRIEAKKAKRAKSRGAQKQEERHGAHHQS
jgi:hypothetical protein